MEREKIREGTYATKINIVNKDRSYLQVLRFKRISSNFYREYPYSFDICESVSLSLTKDLKKAEINICKKDYIYVSEPRFFKRSTSNEIFFLTIYQLKYKKNYCEKIFFDQL